MKLLLDQNLSYRLLARVEIVFPGSSQIHRLGMEHADDAVIWSFAQENGFTIVRPRIPISMRGVWSRAFPPQAILWLKCGNVSTQRVQEILLRSMEAISTFIREGQAACLEIT